jgi:chromosome segregation ATPase
MAAEFDASEFIDDDLQSARKKAQMGPGSETAPSREDVETKVTEMQRKLADLKKAQQDLERERASLEELRRRQVEFTTGREEMLEHLTRGLGLLEEAEFGARRDAEQMAKALAGLRDSLAKIQGIHDETWTKENLHVELTRALTILENGRMEWNTARLKFPILSGSATAQAEGEPGVMGPTPAAGGFPPLQQMMQQQNYAEICKLGLALTWPLALVALAIFLVLLLR